MRDKNDKSRQVQLHEFRLERARRNVHQAQDLLLSLAGNTLQTLKSDLNAEDIIEIRFYPNNSRVIYVSNEECAAVYEDPPSVCRACVNGN